MSSIFAVIPGLLQSFFAPCGRGRKRDWGTPPGPRKGAAAPLNPAYSRFCNSPGCHPERSEESGSTDGEILPLRCTQGFGSRAQDDSPDTTQVCSREVFSPNVWLEPFYC